MEWKFIGLCIGRAIEIHLQIPFCVPQFPRFFELLQISFGFIYFPCNIICSFFTVSTLGPFIAFKRLEKNKINKPELPSMKT